jgi:hypothetical protein
MIMNKERGGDEIEVTPGMIKAGIAAWYAYDSRFEDESDAVMAIFLAMMEASLARA